MINMIAINTKDHWDLLIIAELTNVMKNIGEKSKLTGAEWVDL